MSISNDGDDDDDDYEEPTITAVISAHVWSPGTLALFEDEAYKRFSSPQLDTDAFNFEENKLNGRKIRQSAKWEVAKGFLLTRQTSSAPSFSVGKPLFGKMFKESEADYMT